MRINSRRLRFESLQPRRVLAAVDIADDLVGTPGGQVAVDVDISASAGTRAAEVRLAYDPAVLTLSESDITAGTVWGSGVQVVANIDATAGTVVVFVFSAEAYTGGNGTLLRMNFGVRSTASVGSTTNLNLTAVTLNEGQITVTPAPQSGADSTDGRITINADGSQTGNGIISGFVYADGNQNNSRDSSEGVPDVTIQLLSNGTVVQTTTTDDQGSYSFSSVAAGDYTIRQLQPNAYIDGGSNSIAVTVTNQSDLQDRDFKELGLQPAYLFNRLLSTSVQPAGSTTWIDTLKQIQQFAGSASAGSSSSVATNSLSTRVLTASNSSGSSSSVSANSFSELESTSEIATALTQQLTPEGEAASGSVMVAPMIPTGSSKVQEAVQSTTISTSDVSSASSSNGSSGVTTSPASSAQSTSAAHVDALFSSWENDLKGRSILASLLGSRRR